MQVAPSKPDLHSIQNAISARRFDDALADLAAVLADDPKNTEALYMSAVCHRYKRDFEQALEQLATLKTLAPEHGRAHQEEGHTYRDMGRDDEALLAYSNACRHNPALEASWREQLRILSSRGMQRQAIQVKAQLDRLQALPKPLVAVTDLIAQGRLLKAEDLCRQFMQKNPPACRGHAPARRHRHAARRARRRRVPARQCAQVRARQCDGAHRLRAGAAQAAEIPASPRPRPRSCAMLRRKTHRFQSLFAVQCMQTGDYDTALAAFDEVLNSSLRAIPLR